MHPDDNLFKLISPSDLAPGERKARLYDPRALDVQFIRSADDPLFTEAYGQLWKQFGHLAEMEQRDVIERRMAWDPATPVGDAHLLYEMILIRDRDGRFVAVRDHTAILLRDGGPPIVIVHLSHVLVAPAHRGSGLAGWLRAWPIATAAACAAAVGVVGDVQIALVAEMEHADPTSADRTTRLIAYEKAGFLKVDPSAVDYWQPDFRHATDIDATGVQPLPMGLIVRRVGRENETTISGREVRRAVTALHGMYAVDFRPADMAVVYDHMSKVLPPDDASIRLLPPTEK